MPRFVMVPIKRYGSSRNYNIMRPLSFRPDALRTLLLRNKIATLDELKQALADCRWKRVRSEPMYWNC